MADHPVARAGLSAPGYYRVRMPGSFARYRALGHRTVQGWLEPRVFDLLRTLTDVQQAGGVEGGAAEIGVHHGQLFVALQLLNPGRPAVAIDVFGDQQLNRDSSGEGDLAWFRANVERWGDPATLVVRQADSTTLTGDDVRELAQGPVRLFSVDGGHTEDVVRTDLRTAEEALADGGVVVLDDVFNPEWPGVSVGTLRYLDADPALEPFAIGFNKVFLTQPPHAATYRTALRTTFGRRWRVAHKTSVFHGSDVEVFWPEALTPRTVLRRNPWARRVWRSLRKRSPDG